MLAKGDAGEEAVAGVALLVCPVPLLESQENAAAHHLDKHTARNQPALNPETLNFVIDFAQTLDRSKQIPSVVIVTDEGDGFDPRGVAAVLSTTP